MPLQITVDEASAVLIAFAPEYRFKVERLLKAATRLKNDLNMTPAQEAEIDLEMGDEDRWGDLS